MRVLTAVVAVLGSATVAQAQLRSACEQSVTGVDCQNRTNRMHSACEAYIHIAGMFPLSHSVECFDGIQCLAAAEAAVADVNYAGTTVTGADGWNHVIHTVPTIGGGTSPLFEFPDAWMVDGVDVCASTSGLTPDADNNCCIGVGAITGGPECKSYCLRMHAEDTESDPGMALFKADSFMNTPWTSYASVDLFVGGLTSEVSQSLQQLLQHNGIPQVSYASTSPLLSSKKDYPTFLRTVPSDGQLVAGVSQFVAYFEWKMITILAINAEFGQAGATELFRQLNGLGGIAGIGRVEVVNNLLFTEDDINEKLEIIKASESRIVFVHCGIHDAKVVFAAAHNKEMLEEFTWIGSEWAQDTMWEEWGEGTEAWTSEDELMKAELNGIVAIRAGGSCLSAADGETAECATRQHVESTVLTKEAQLGSQYACSEMKPNLVHVNQYASFAYDAVLVGATALHRSLAKGNSLSNFTNTFAELRGMEGSDMQICNTATGDIVIDSRGDRIMPFDIVNMREGEWESVGGYAPVQCPTPGTCGDAWELKLDVEEDSEKAIKWAGEQTRIPSDRTEEHVSLAALYLSFMLSFIVMSICAGNFLHAHEFYVLPESGAAVLFGLALGGVLLVWGQVFGHTEELTDMTEFDTEIFSLILLPIIIFAAGFNLRKSDFVNNLAPICLTAFIGTSISSVFVGTVVFYWGRDEWLGGFKFGSLGGAESLAFGALISAVDPVATLAVFGALGVETDLNMRVFGESVINDGVSIVLFRVFCRYITEEVTTESVLQGVGQFVMLLIGSIVVGVLCAIFLAFVMKHSRLHSHTIETICVVLGSYSAYSAAEAFHFSGIIASLIAGIAMNHWSYHNFTYDGEVLCRRTVKMLSLMADTIIFFQVGQNIVVSVSDPDWGFIGVTLMLCLIGRMINILPLCGLYNLCASEKRKISMAHQCVMIHAGLRGGIAFFVALSFPSQHIHVVINTCMWVILFTIFVLGGTCVAFLNVMGVEIGCDSNDVKDVKQSKHSKEIKGCAQKFDRTILLPCVTWRFEADGNDTYIENPGEARAFRKALPWPPTDDH